ncbi:metallophosphoesterase [Cronobacter turicensis]
MKLAAISDIHGNLLALEAVLEDIEKHNVDVIVNLGDILSGGLFPSETADRLLPLNLPTIRGNHERQLLETAPEKMGLSDSHAYRHLSPEHLEWLRKMPAGLTLHNDILLVHGTPGNDKEYLLEEVTETGVRESSHARIYEHIKHHNASLILCGHTHIPRSVEISSTCLIVNPGSVGLQAYDDEHPFFHKMEAGSPHARYAILEKRANQWTVNFRKVVYDWEKAARLALENDRPDWVNALRTGKM